MAQAELEREERRILAALSDLVRQYVAQLGGMIAQHAEDPGLCRNGHMHEGSVSSRLGITGLPSVGEEVIVARDLGG